MGSKNEQDGCGGIEGMEEMNNQGNVRLNTCSEGGVKIEKQI